MVRTPQTHFQKVVLEELKVRATNLLEARQMGQRKVVREWQLVIARLSRKLEQRREESQKP